MKALARSTLLYTSVTVLADEAVDVCEAEAASEELEVTEEALLLQPMLKKGNLEVGLDGGNMVTTA